VDQWISGGRCSLPRPTEGEPRPDASNARRQRPATRAIGVSRAFACVLNTRGDTPWEVAQDRRGPRPGDETRLDALLGRFAGPGPLLVLCCIRLVLNDFSTASMRRLTCPRPMPNANAFHREAVKARHVRGGGGGGARSGRPGCTSVWCGCTGTHPHTPHTPLSLSPFPAPAKARSRGRRAPAALRLAVKPLTAQKHESLRHTRAHQRGAVAGERSRRFFRTSM
jgi:hypothetical protein